MLVFVPALTYLGGYTLALWAIKAFRIRGFVPQFVVSLAIGVVLGTLVRKAILRWARM